MGAISTAAPDLWLKADAIVGLTDGQVVSSWTDSSGNGRHAVQATSGRQPLYKTNVVGSLPGVLFDGSDDRLASTMSASGSAQTIVAVVRPAGTGTRTISGGAFQLRIESSNTTGLVSENLALLGVSRGTVSTGAAHVLTGTYAAAANVSTRADGTNDFYTTGATVVGSTTTVIGAHTNGTETFNGHILEYIRWGRVLTATELVDVEAELAAKWGSIALTVYPAITGATVTASGNFGGWDPWHVFDGVNASGASNAWTHGAVAPAWLRAQLSVAAAVTSYSIAGYSSTQSPKDWTLEGSNDGSSWTTLDTQTGFSSWTTAQVRTFTISNTTAYLYYRLNISAVSGASSDWPTINEWSLFTTASTSTTGAVSAAASVPTLAVAGTVTRMGDVAAVAPSPTVAVTGDVVGITSGEVVATAPSPTLAVAGTVTAPITGTVSATAPMASLFVTDGVGDSADSGIGFGSEVVGDAGIDLILDAITGGWGVGSEIVGDITVNIDRIDTGITIGSRLLDPRSRVADPRTTRPQVQLRVIDHDGVPSCDLAPRATIGTDVTDPLNEASEFDFTLPARDPGTALVTPTAGSKPPMVQLWRGSYLHKAGWYYVIKAVPSDDGAFLTFKCVDIRWPLEGNLIGKIPRRNLLSNGDFQSGDAGSVYGWDDGSTPAMYPLHQIVDDDFTDGGKALELVGADRSQLVTAEFESAAVFVPNSSSYLTGGAAIVQALAASIPDGSEVHLVGHTANDGTGNGLALSLARAQAAKATMHAAKPSLTFTLPDNWSAIDSDKRVDDGSVGGRGYYQPKASNATEAGRKQNRRVTAAYLGVDDGTNSAQWESRSIRITNPTSSRRALPVTFVAWFKLIQFTGQNKDNLALRLVLVKASAPTVEVASAEVTLDEDTEIGAWKQVAETLEIPANSVEYILTAHSYAPHGTVRWTRRGFYPDDALTFYGTDQALIVKALIEHAQDPAMGKTDWGIGTYCRATGVKRRRVYPYRDHNSVSERIWNDFPTLDRGMDVDVYTSPWSRKIRTHFPRQGSTSETVLALGHNVVSYSAAVDLTQTATVVVAQADDIGAFREEAHYRNTSGLGGLVLEKVISAERETPIDELDELARDGVKRFGRPVVDLRVECDPRATSDLLDELDKGDTVRVIIHDAGIDIDTLYRVVDYPWNPETDGLSVGLVLEV